MHAGRLGCLNKVEWVEWTLRYEFCMTWQSLSDSPSCNRTFSVNFSAVGHLAEGRSLVVAGKAEVSERPKTSSTAST
jgi:hypothetical protein